MSGALTQQSIDYAGIGARLTQDAVDRIGVDPLVRDLALKIEAEANAVRRGVGGMYTTANGAKTAKERLTALLIAADQLAGLL